MLKVPMSVCVGPMFAGKTSSLLAKADRLMFEGVCPLFFKPLTDTRDEDEVASHRGFIRQRHTHDAVSVRGLYQAAEEALTTIFPMREEGLVTRFAAFFDEVQFFEEEAFTIHDLADFVAETEVESVHCFGLNLDARGKAWPTVAALLPYATEIVGLSSVCKACRAPAHRTQRRTPWPSGEAVAVGAGADYEPRCVRCWSPEPLG